MERHSNNLSSAPFCVLLDDFCLWSSPAGQLEGRQTAGGKKGSNNTTQKNYHLLPLLSAMVTGKVGQKFIGYFRKYFTGKKIEILVQVILLLYC